MIFIFTKFSGFTTKGNESIFCESCEDKHSAIAHCHECKEDLCERCTQAHRRVKFTKGHTIAPLSFGGRPDNSGSTQQQPPFKVGANSTQLMLNRYVTCNNSVFIIHMHLALSMTIINNRSFGYNRTSCGMSQLSSLT